MSEKTQIKVAFSGGKKMPDKNDKFYIGDEEDGTRVFWIPYYRITEYHRPDGTIDIIKMK